MRFFKIQFCLLEAEIIFLKFDLESGSRVQSVQTTEAALFDSLWPIFAYYFFGQNLHMYVLEANIALLEFDLIISLTVIKCYQQE